LLIEIWVVKIIIDSHEAGWVIRKPEGGLVKIPINSTIQRPVAGDVKGENGIKHVVVFASRSFERQTAILEWTKGLLVVFEAEVVEGVFIRRIKRSLIIEEECCGLC